MMIRFQVAMAVGTANAQMVLYIPRLRTSRKVGISPPLKKKVMITVTVIRPRNASRRLERA